MVNKSSQNGFKLPMNNAFQTSQKTNKRSHKGRTLGALSVLTIVTSVFGGYMSSKSIHDKIDNIGNITKSDTTIHDTIQGTYSKSATNNGVADNSNIEKIVHAKDGVVVYRYDGTVTFVPDHNFTGTDTIKLDDIKN